MMKVAIAGTNGLARCLFQRLQERYHACLLLTRSRNIQPTSGNSIVTVSYRDEDYLVYTLSGVDIVISMVTGNDQLMLIDAALKAGVTRFVPAEFGGLPDLQTMHPVLDRGRRLALMRLRDHVEEGMEYTIITCGLFYERLGPGGLRAVNIGNVQGANGEDDFLVNRSAMKAEIPLDGGGEASMVCMTSVDDVAQFIVAALTIPSWPREFRIRGERISVRDIVEIVSEARDLSDLERIERDRTALQSSLRRAERSQDQAEQQRLHTLLMIADGKFDYQPSNLNDSVTWQPMPFRDWLHGQWALIL